MVHYFTHAPPADAAWAVHFLSGERPKRLISVRRLAAWATQASGIPDWLFEECYTAVGDLAETITLLLPESTAPLDRPLHVWIEDHLLTLAGREETEQRDAILASWRELGGIERFVWNKLITGGFRVGVLQPLRIRALSRAIGNFEGGVARRPNGPWQVCFHAGQMLSAVHTSAAAIINGYSFYLDDA